MNIEIQNDFQKKVMSQSFGSPFHVRTIEDVAIWRDQWMKELKSWHSPYALLLDCSNLYLTFENDKVKASLDRMFKFFGGFFLKKIVAFGFDDEKGHDQLPFTPLKDESIARAEVGLDRRKISSERADLRSLIQIQNHFAQHTVEVNFAGPVRIHTKEDLNVLRSKLTNNLSQWHSKWNLLVDCTDFELDEVVHDEFDKMIRFFRGLFLKSIVGYNVKAKEKVFPFPSYRVRHQAAAALENEGFYSGDEANCNSRKIDKR